MCVLYLCMWVCFGPGTEIDHIDLDPLVLKITNHCSRQSGAEAEMILLTKIAVSDKVCTSLVLGGRRFSRPVPTSPLSIRKEGDELTVEGEGEGGVWFSRLHAALKVVPCGGQSVNTLTKIGSTSTKHLRHLSMCELPTGFAVSTTLDCLADTPSRLPGRGLSFSSCACNWWLCRLQPCLPHYVPPVKIFLLRTSLVRILRIPG